MRKVIRYLKKQYFRLIRKYWELKRNKWIWKRINREYDRIMFSTARHLILKKHDSIDQTCNDLEWIAKKAIISDTAKRYIKLRHSVIVALICILPIVLSSAIRVDSTPVVCNVVSDNLSIELDSDWSAEHQFSPNTFALDYVVSANSGGLIPPSNEALNINTPESPISVSLKGDGITIRKIMILSGAIVDFTFKRNTLKIYIKESSLKATLYASKANLTLPQPNGHRSILISVKNSNPPETLHFETKKVQEIPILLELGLGKQKKWLVKGIKAKSINFSEEIPPGSGQFRSTIQTGEIQLKENNETIPLSTS